MPRSLSFFCCEPACDILHEPDLHNYGLGDIARLIDSGEPYPPRWSTLAGHSIWDGQSARTALQHLEELKIAGLPLALYKCYWGEVVAHVLSFDSLESFSKTIFNAHLSDQSLKRVVDAVQLAMDIGVLDAEGFFSPTNGQMPLCFTRVRCIHDTAKRAAYSEPERLVNEAWLVVVTLKLLLLQHQGV